MYIKSLLNFLLQNLLVLFFILEYMGVWWKNNYSLHINYSIDTVSFIEQEFYTPVFYYTSIDTR